MLCLYFVGGEQFSYRVHSSSAKVSNLLCPSVVKYINEHIYKAVSCIGFPLTYPDR